MLVSYDDSDEEEEEGAHAAAPPLPTALRMVADATGRASDEDDSDSGEDVEPSGRKSDLPAAGSVNTTSAAESTGSSALLPDFEDAIAGADTPAFLSAPPAEFEHETFDIKPEVPAQAAAASAGSSKGGDAAASGRASVRQDVSAAAARERQRGGKGSGKGSGKGEKEKLDLKERTKLKRQRDQSASFLGGRWKSEEEMHMRDNFDS